MRHIIAVLFLLTPTLAGADCGGFLELGAGVDNQLESGKNPMSVIRVRWEICSRSRWVPDVIEIDHHSSFTEGRPFNHRPEDTANQISAIWRIRIW